MRKTPSNSPNAFPAREDDCCVVRRFQRLQGRLDLDGFVSETIDLDQVEDAFHKMEAGEVLRSVVIL